MRRIKVSLFLPGKQLLSVQGLLESSWKRCTWGFLLSIPFVPDILQTPMEMQREITHGLSFQNHNLKDTLPQIATQKWAEEKVKPAFH